MLNFGSLLWIPTKLNQTKTSGIIAGKQRDITCPTHLEIIEETHALNISNLVGLYIDWNVEFSEG